MSQRHIRLSIDKHEPNSTLTPNLTSSRLLSYFNFIQQRWGKFSEPHVCALIGALKGTKIVQELIDTGVFIKCRRWLWKCVMVNEKHPYTKLVFKSMTEIRNEEVKHLLNYPYMIHPFSMFCLYLEFFMALVHIFYLGYVLPMNIYFTSNYNTMKWIKFNSDLIMTGYMIANFFIGHWDNENMVVKMKQKVVAIHYLKTYFIWDVLSCLSSYLIFILASDIRYTYWPLFKWFGILRIVRYSTIKNANYMLRVFFNIPVELYITIQIVLRTCLVILCCMGLMALLSEYSHIFHTHISTSENHDIETAKEVFFTTITAMFGVGKLEIAHTSLQAVINIFITVVSIVLQLWIMAKLYILWQRYIALSQVGEDYYQQLSRYLKYKGLPPQIREQLYAYYDFRFQGKFYDESNIQKILTENLRKEIPYYRLNKAVEKIKFIRLLTNPMTMKVVSQMKSLYYCPGDVVFRVNSPSKHLYFILNGTVALHDENGIEICHLEDGAYYGDIAVVITQIHMVTMTAITPCKIYSLKSNVLKQILAPFPDIHEKVLELTHTLLMNRKKEWLVDTSQSHRSITVFEDDNYSSTRIRGIVPNSVTFI